MGANLSMVHHLNKDKRGKEYWTLERFGRVIGEAQITWLPESKQRDAT